MRYRRDVVRQVLDIMEEGPLPLRDAKPAEKTKTGVELFRDSNQAYVASDPGLHMVDRVNEHNSTYPKMDDELNRRRSTSKATVLASYAGLCVSNTKPQPKPRRISNSKWKRPRTNTRRNKQRRGVDKKAKTNAARRFSTKKVFPLCTCGRLNVGCQCSSLKEAQNRMSGTDDILTFDLSIPQSTDFAPMDVFIKSQSVIQPTSSQHGGSIKSLYRKNEDVVGNNSNYGIASAGNPDTSDPSISSYNSYASTGQEPMV